MSPFTSPKPPCNYTFNWNLNKDHFSEVLKMREVSESRSEDLWLHKVQKVIFKNSSVKYFSINLIQIWVMIINKEIT